MTDIAVTGATGRLGGTVARLLSDAGVRQRLVVRDPSRMARISGATVAQAEFGDRPAVVRALSGVSTVLMVSAGETVDRLQSHQSFIDAAVAAGVKNVVYTSFYGAAPDATFTLARDHFHTEQYLKASGLDHTVLRDNLYLDSMASKIGPDGVIRGPANGGTVSAVAISDIAACAAAVLRDPSNHAGTRYDLTGPESLTMAEIAKTFTTVTGRAVRFKHETLEQAYRSRESFNAPSWQVQAWVSTYLAIASGELAAISSAVPDLVGRPALGLSRLLTSAAESAGGQ